MIETRRAIPAKDIKLLLWDLDGTLVNSELDLALAINALLRHLGRPELPVEVVAGYVGDGAPMLVRRALGDPADETFVKRSLEYFLTHYREHLLDNTYAYPGVMETLRALRERKGVNMAVLTNKPVNPSQAICDGLGIAPLMARVLGGNSLPTKKPDPAGARVLMQDYGARPEETVMIGDSQNDVLTAVNAGMFSVGVTYGLSPESLKIHKPDVLIDQPAELLTVLGV